MQKKQNRKTLYDFVKRWGKLNMYIVKKNINYLMPFQKRNGLRCILETWH